ncbi:hypothetical protein ACWCQP_36745 [Streptomyces chartreusis]
MAKEPENTAAAPDESGEYTRRLAAALEANREEQKAITAHLAQLSRLQQRLEQLREHERWLADTVEATPPAADASAETERAEPSRAVAQAPVPLPRHEESGPPGAPARKAARPKTRTKAGPKKTAPKKAPAAKTAAKKSTSPSNTSRTSGGTTLGELVLAVLNHTPGEPRTAAEVTADLAQAYPDRARDTNNVRNVLEGLVAKSLIERSKQKRSVHYTVQGQQTGDPADGTVAEPSPAAEDAASETVSGAA